MFLQSTDFAIWNSYPGNHSYTELGYNE